MANDYGTFLPMLKACVERTTGPVLELGMGETSTPYLNQISKTGKNGRYILSAETDFSWFETYRHFASDYHRLSFVGRHTVVHSKEDVRIEPDWIAWDGFKHDVFWDVCLLDCAPGEARKAIALILANACKFIVAHDFEEIDRSTPCGSNYGWADILPHFKYVYIDKSVRPWTAVLSNFEEFKP